MEVEVTPEMARQHWLPWGVYASQGNFRVYKHIRRMSNAIERCITGQTPSRRLAIEISPQHGKQLAHYTPVLTTEGWKKHGDLRPGDYVYGRGGSPVRVLAIGEESPQDCRVHFADGDYIDCHERHEWLVRSRTAHKELIRESRDIERSGTRSPDGRGRTRRNFSLPQCGTIKGTKDDFDIDPYLLGTWLGDGERGGRYFTCFAPSDSEGFHWIAENLNPPGLRTYEHSTTGVMYASMHGFKSKIRSLGLYRNKRIPDEYLTASVTARLDLLAGLMDTDGYFYRKNGRATFSTACPDLAEDVCTLLATFGWRAACHWQEPSAGGSPNGVPIVSVRPCCQVTFNHDMHIPCRIPRKLASQMLTRQRRIGIDRIERIDPVMGRCIQVEGGLYRVGKRLKLTHNSLLCSNYFPLWYYGRNPHHQIGIVSHGQDLANRFGETNRVLFQEYAPAVFGLELDKKSSRRENWRAKGYPHGGMVAVGVDGSLIGKRLDGLVIDDPFKNAKQANSPTEREKVWDFYGAVAQARLTKNAWVIAIHQRLHAEDFIGRIRMNNEDLPENEKWEVLSLPAIAVEDEFWEDGTPFRKAGEALWPEFKPLEFLDQQRRTMGDYYWNCLYQQRPTQYEGTMWDPALFNEAQLVEKWPDKVEHLIMALDPASGKDVSKGDYPALVALGTTGDGRLYVEALMNRQSPRHVAESIPQFAGKLPRLPDCLLCERTLLQDIYFEQIAKAMERASSFFPIFPIEHEGVPKMDRIMRLDPFVTNGDISFIRSKGTSILLQQLKNFPHPQEHDDGPDALEMCLRGLRMVHKVKVA